MRNHSSCENKCHPLPSHYSGGANLKDGEERGIGEDEEKED